MKSSVSAVALGVLIALASGCVSQRTADDLSLKVRTLQEQLVERDAEIEELNQRLALLASEGRSSEAMIADLTLTRSDLEVKVASLQRELDELRETNRELRSRRTNAPLPAKLENALKQFAERYSQLATFDEAEGAVRFRSDLTFPLGSAELGPQARQSLQQLAQIFESPEAAEYEIRIVGHTDTVKISKPETRAKHPTNWHLSVHRAIAVRDALDQAGLPPVRTSVAGYGPYRPVVPNGPRGAEANRRVEIYLMPMGDVNREMLQPQESAGQSGEAAGNATSTGGNGGSATATPARNNQTYLTK